MIRYIATRCLYMIPTLLLASMVIFTIIQLPPGDYVETYIGELIASGQSVDLARADYLREEYGLNQPMWWRYLLWIGNFVTGDFGYSFEYQRPVSEVIGNRLWLTILVSFFTIILTWVIAFPIGIYSATHQYSWGDYGLTFVGLLGMATPNFLLALLLMYFAKTHVRHVHRRVDGGQIYRPGDELGKILVGDGASHRAHHRDRHGRHRRDDPPYPRQPAR